MTSCQDEDADEWDQACDWYDFWSIGGRFSGHKLKAAIGDNLQAFYDKMKEERITVSGLQFGKPTLQPTSQQEKVDAMWREMFPGTVEQCPLFDHAPPCVDWCLVKDIPEVLTAERVIIARSNDDGLSATFMVVQQLWNGFQWQDTTFDGSVTSALKAYAEKSKWNPTYYKPVPDDWIVVTVDYHN
jgi:hypothetical protein